MLERIFSFVTIQPLVRLINQACTIPRVYSDAGRLVMSTRNKFGRLVRESFQILPMIRTVEFRTGEIREYGEAYGLDTLDLHDILSLINGLLIAVVSNSH